MRSLILDLRNNPGGIFESALDVSELLLPGGKPIVSVKGRDPRECASFSSSGKRARPQYPLVVLVNEGSASASEIVAGAVQDNKRGTVAGGRTFGKAAVQEVIPLKDGSALKLTTASYYTPAGRLIKNGGIVPDVIFKGHKASGEKASDVPEEVLKEREVATGAASVTAGGKGQERDADLEEAVALIGKMVPDGS
jgi:carboxyl-terminal processing protease